MSEIDRARTEIERLRRALDERRGKAEGENAYLRKKVEVLEEMLARSRAQAEELRQAYLQSVAFRAECERQILALEEQVDAFRAREREKNPTA